LVANTLGRTYAMKVSWFSVASVLTALLSGPLVVISVWFVAALAAEAGFLVLPDGAPRFSGSKGREAHVTEIVATRDQTGGSIGLFRQTIAPKSGPPTHIHQTEDEFFYVVKGEFRLKLGDQS
jgi:hypothetical protein